MPFQVNNIYALFAVVAIVLIPALVPTIPALLNYLETRAARRDVREVKTGLIEVKSAVVDVHSIINSGAELANARSHEEGRLQGVAESETDAAAQAHNAERKGPKT